MLLLLLAYDDRSIYLEEEAATQQRPGWPVGAISSPVLDYAWGWPGQSIWSIELRARAARVLAVGVH